ncbi:MAG: hypothetical protein IIA59_02095 [Candidatus Marinimicrobia bacterium]|nr:hypothetical protein [Candidatus Neomarinimicrobiota bacterium]
MKLRLRVCKLCIFALVAMMPCAAQTQLLKSGGDTATIFMLDQSGMVGEVLAIGDNTIYFDIKSGLPDAQMPLGGIIIGVHVNDLDFIEIKGYSNRKWIPMLIAFEVVPTLLLGIAAASVNAEVLPIMAIFSIPTVINLAILAASTPASPRFERPFTPEKLEELRKYARFAQGLTAAQLEQLLFVNKQSEVRLLK